MLNNSLRVCKKKIKDEIYHPHELKLLNFQNNKGDYLDLSFWQHLTKEVTFRVLFHTQTSSFWSVI